MSDSTPSQPTPEPDPSANSAVPGENATPTAPSNPGASAPEAPGAPTAPAAPEAPPAATAPAAHPDHVWQSAQATAHPGGGNDKPKRNTTGLVAALAIGALIGGVSGAGVYAVATNNAGGSTVQAPKASNITVNDPGNATSITAVAAAAGPSVVTISVTGTQEAGTGSGVILSKDGYVLTNAHVATLSGSTADPTIKVETSDGRLFNAKLIGTDPIADLAVVKIEANGVEFAPATFADSSKLNVGDTVVAVGAPLGLANTVTSGIISALNRSITVASSAVPKSQADTAPDSGSNNGNGPFDFWQFNSSPQSGSQTANSTIALPVIQTDAAINPGNSGGALLDSEARVIGINVAIASTGGSSSQSTSGSIGVGFAIPANVAKRISEDLIKTGTASHGLLGASVADVTEDTNLSASATVGASIQEVTPGGAADKAGLRKGDVVTEFDGVPITGKTDLTAQVRVLAGGAKAQLVFVRGNKTETVTVTLGTL